MSVATRDAVSPLQDTSRSIVALLLSLSPAYFLFGARCQFLSLFRVNHERERPLTPPPLCTTAKLGIDNLHVGLIQVVLLLVLRSLLDVVPTFRSSSSTPVSKPPVTIAIEREATTKEATTETKAVETTQKRQGRRRRRRTTPKEATSTRAPPFPTDKLDDNVANFISTVEPAFLVYLPESSCQKTRSTGGIPPCSVSTWTETYRDDSRGILVAHHPSVKTLFAISCRFRDVSVHKLYDVLVDLDSRPQWDSMTFASREVERFESDDGRYEANVSHMQMKGMPPLVKQKDLVLLSVPGRLPRKSDDNLDLGKGGPTTDRMRIFCASTSVEHDQARVSPEFNRMQLSVSGFLIEQDGDDSSSRIVQITDLSGLGCEFSFSLSNSALFC